MKYSKWIGVLAGIVLIIVCFMPWTYYADLQKTFTGFFSERNAYGKPGKLFVSLATIFIVLSFISKLWARRINLFLSAIMVAYAIKTYILYTSCYNAYCPEKKTGIYLVVMCSLVILIAALVPDMKIDKKINDKDAS